jgi:hypothetical protein
MGTELLIVAAARVIDGRGSLSEVNEVQKRLEAARARIAEYRVAPLSFGWNSPLPDGYIKSACAPIEALIESNGRIAAGELDAVLITGTDLIKSEFAGRGAERDRLMLAYGDHTFLKAFDELAGVLREHLSLSSREFDELADGLFENYWRTWSALHTGAVRPDQRWFEKVTPHFRGVDCANPSIDFEGALLATTSERAFAVGCDPAIAVAVQGMSVAQRCDDGIEHIPEIIFYDHLKSAYEEACGQAGLDVGELWLGGDARVEIYSCYPVVPIAFLFATSLAGDASEMKRLLAEHPVTITGGLNLGRAPWNNSTLSAIVQAVGMIRSGTSIIGVHSNAALGYKQGFLVLTMPAV